MSTADTTTTSSWREWLPEPRGIFAAISRILPHRVGWCLTVLAMVVFAVPSPVVQHDIGLMMVCQLAVTASIIIAVYGFDPGTVGWALLGCVVEIALAGKAGYEFLFIFYPAVVIFTMVWLVRRAFKHSRILKTRAKKSTLFFTSLLSIILFAFLSDRICIWVTGNTVFHMSYGALGLDAGGADQIDAVLKTTFTARIVICVILLIATLLSGAITHRVPVQQKATYLPPDNQHVYEIRGPSATMNEIRKALYGYLVSLWWFYHDFKRVFRLNMKLLLRLSQDIVLRGPATLALTAFATSVIGIIVDERDYRGLMEVFLPILLFLSFALIALVMQRREHAKAAEEGATAADRPITVLMLANRIVFLNIPLAITFAVSVRAFLAILFGNVGPAAFNGTATWATLEFGLLELIFVIALFIHRGKMPSPTAYRCKKCDQDLFESSALARGIDGFLYFKEAIKSAVVMTENPAFEIQSTIACCQGCGSAVASVYRPAEGNNELRVEASHVHMPYDAE